MKIQHLRRVSRNTTVRVSRRADEAEFFRWLSKAL
jgi:hypothetical protein